MTRPLIALLAGALLLSSASHVPEARSQVRACSKHDELVRMLERRYQETRRSFGLASRTRLVELFVSKAGTWTIVVTTPKRMACILASGRDWHDTRSKPPGSGAAFPLQ